MRIELRYDWDELLQRLTAQGCVCKKAPLRIHSSSGHIQETFVVERAGRTHHLQVPPRSGNPTWSVVRSLCDRLELPYGPFDL